MGFSCEVIDLYRPTHQGYKESQKYRPYRAPKQSKMGKIKKWFLGHKNKHYLPSETQKKFNAFNAKIRYSKPYKGIEELYANPPEYNIYITGSDQLWNPTMEFCIEPYFLTFASETAKKISFATSIGISSLVENEQKDFQKWLNNYSSISVRERSAQQLLQTIINKEIQQIPDPTFLLDKTEWKSLMKIPSINKPYILLFTLKTHSILDRYIVQLAKESGYKPVILSLNHPEVQDDNVVVVSNAGPEELLGYITNAQMVITNSFHGTVFSLLLSTKNFFSYIEPSANRGYRIIDLLKLFDLESHILNSTDLDYHSLSRKTINRESVISIIDSERKRSIEYLLTAVNK